MNICDLTPGKVVDITLTVLRKHPLRRVISQTFTGNIAAACGRDDTGIVGIVLWGEDAVKVNAGDRIRILNGSCTERTGEMVVTTGQTGTLTIVGA